MSRVLVTGGTGFVGRNCLLPLQELGFEVHGLCIDSVEGLPVGVRWHPVSLFDAEALRGVMELVAPTHLLHLAWHTAPGEYWTSLKNLAWCRVTLELLQLAADTGATRVVCAGSCAEYDWSAPNGICREGETPEVPATLYGVSKKAMHDVAMALDVQGVVRAAWGRLFFLYGPHEHPARLVPSVINSLHQGQAAECTSGTQVRDFIHVADAGAALSELLASEVCGAVNIATGHGVPVREIVEALGEKMGRSDLVRLGARPAPEGEPPVLVADVTRLTEEVGWTPTRGLDEGLEQTIRWWRDKSQTE